MPQQAKVSKVQAKLLKEVLELVNERRVAIDRHDFIVRDAARDHDVSKLDLIEETPANASKIRAIENQIDSLSRKYKVKL